jgi:hypothetical protein
VAEMWREAGGNAVGQVHPKRCESEGAYWPFISSRVLAHGPELLRTRVARVLAPGGRGSVLWSLSVCANDWLSAEKLTRLCIIPEPAMFSETWDRTPYAMEAKILRPLLWFRLLEHRSEKLPPDTVSNLASVRHTTVSMTNPADRVLGSAPSALDSV